MERVNVKMVRVSDGTCRVFCQRAKYKWWFELGRHAETDTAFEQALAAGTLRWKPGIEDGTKLF